MDPRQSYLLYMDDGRQVDADEMKLLGDRNGVFPRRLATQDFSFRTSLSAVLRRYVLQIHRAV